MVRIKYKVVPNIAGDRCFPSPTSESNLSGRLDGPRKKDPAAMNSPKHMRQRCRAMRFAPRTPPPTNMRTRSEEHTSELQSRFDLVCRLLLEKKKKTNKK